MEDINGYDLSRKWFNWCFENPERISPNHTALYFFIIEHCNRLGWKKKFGLPSGMAKEAIGIRSYKTYIKTLKELVDFGFIEMIEKSKNQYSSNIVALVYFAKAHTKAHTKALDKAMIKHMSKQGESTYQSIESIDKPITNKPITIEVNEKTIEVGKKDVSPKKKKFSFEKALLEYGFDKKLSDEWLIIRKSKKAVNSELAFKNFIREVEKTEMNKYGLKNKDDLMYFIAVKKQWRGYEAKWLDREFNAQNNGSNPDTDRLEWLANYAAKAFDEN